MLLNRQLAILEAFTGDYTVKLTGSALAKKKKLNQKTVANHLARWEKEHLLKSKTEGKNKVYFLNLENKELTKEFILAIEHCKTLAFYKSNPLIKEIAAKIKPHIDGIALIFGSYAKKTQDEDSDLDLLIIGKAQEAAIEEIAQRYEQEISLKIYPQLQDDILTREAIKNHILIKNAECFVEEVL